MEKYISIKEAKYINDYKISFKFNDNKETLVDFKKFILNSMHPNIQKYQNKKLFKHSNIANGDVEWNDYELAFPIYDLYTGVI